MYHQTLRTVKALVAQAAERQPNETTVRTYTGDLVTGCVTFVGQIKFRLDTTQAALFIEYTEVEEVI